MRLVRQCRCGINATGIDTQRQVRSGFLIELLCRQRAGICWRTTCGTLEIACQCWARWQRLISIASNAAIHRLNSTHPIIASQICVCGLFGIIQLNISRASQAIGVCWFVIRWPKWFIKATAALCVIRAKFAFNVGCEWSNQMALLKFPWRMGAISKNNKIHRVLYERCMC